MSEVEAHAEKADQHSGAAVEYACAIVADTFGKPAQEICHFLFQNGPSTLREVGMGTELPKSVVSKGLMVLIQHNFIEALLHDQVVAARIFASIRQPAFLVHIADTMGPSAEKVCQQLVANGRLDFYSIVDHIIAQEQAQATGEEQPNAEQIAETCATAVMKLLQRRLIEQAPPCDMPLMFAPTKAKSRARQPKVSEEQKKLDAGHQLTVAQYQKIRHKYPDEVLRATTPDGSEKKAARELVLLRMNIDAFSVHFKNEAIQHFVCTAYDQSVSKVMQAIMDLTRDAEMARVAKPNAGPNSVSMDAIVKQIRHNQRKEKAAREAEEGPAPMDIDTTSTPGTRSTPGGTPSVNNSDAEGEDEEMDVDTALQLMEDSQLVQADDDHVACYIFEPNSILMMAQSNIVAGYMRERFGERGHRVWRIILEHKYLQVDAIEKEAMLGTRDVRTILHVLFQQGYLSMQELPRTADRTPSKTVFLYHVNFEAVLKQLRIDLCTAAGNLIKRAAWDTEKHNSLLALVQRQVAGDSVRLSASQLKSASAWQQRTRFIYASLLSLDAMFQVFM